MTEQECFRDIPYQKKYAKLPVKERVNIFNEGNWIWRNYYMSGIYQKVNFGKDVIILLNKG